ncbi:glycosyltransferase [Candidatus Gottesmanbacteria bacterium]|nr:glycosyltransferase [Candidatus Gottesmanbacteria bacterium]
MKKTKNKRLRILFATFSPYRNGKRESTNGNVEPMVKYFGPRVSNFILLDQPHTGSDEIIPHVEVYKSRKRKKAYILNMWYLRPLYWVLGRIRTTDDDTNLLFKIRDILSVLAVRIQEGGYFDVFIGFESVNALAGIILKKVGLVKTVVYYVSDYSPVRYQNSMFNFFYVLLDRICCYWSDYIWDVSRAMHPARIEAGLIANKSAPVVHVPNGLEKRFIRHISEKHRIPHSLVFMGTLGIENGPDIAVASLPLVLKKIPDVTLHIIGKGDKDLERLKRLAMQANLENQIIFDGYIKDTDRMFATIRRFALALAPYRKIKNSVRWYGDSLKLRAYTAAGVPVIVSSVPPLGRELADIGAAIVAEDSAEGFAREIIRVFNDERAYSGLVKSAVEYGKHQAWERTYSQAMKEMPVL